MEYLVWVRCRLSPHFLGVAEVFSAQHIELYQRVGGADILCSVHTLEKLDTSDVGQPVSCSRCSWRWPSGEPLWHFLWHHHSLHTHPHDSPTAFPTPTLLITCGFIVFSLRAGAECVSLFTYVWFAILKFSDEITWRSFVNKLKLWMCIFNTPCTIYL